MVRSSLKQFVIAALLMPIVATMGCSSTSNTAATQASPGSQTASSRPQLKVVTTFLPMYLFTKAVARDAAQVDILLKPGTEVHEYQATPADVQAIAQANVVVKNGMGLETFLDKTIKSAENPQLKVIDASQGIQPIEETSQIVSLNAQQAEDHANEKDHADEKSAGKASSHSHADGNPHIWLSPVLAQKQVENIRDGLIAADPANQATYQANAAAYIQQLSNLNRQFEQSLKKYQDRTFVTFHDAFPYLAKQYQLQQVAVVEIPEDQLSPTDVQTTVEAVKLFKVKALFGEPGTDNKLLSTLSQDLKLTVHPLTSLESGNLDPQYYFTAMKTNLQNLETAFK